MIIVKLKKKIKKMVDWKRLGFAVLSVAFIGGLIAILLFAPKVFAILGEVAIVCIGIFLLVYKALGD